MIAEKGVMVRTEAGPRFIMINGNRQEIDHKAGQLSLLQFDHYALDLSQFVQRYDERWLEPGERYLHELFWPGTGVDDLANAGRMRAEGHDRLAAPLYSLTFTMIALAAILAGDFNRRGRRIRIMMAIGSIAIVRTAGLGLVGLSAKIPALIPLLYLNEFIIIAVCLRALVRERFWSSRRSSIAPGGPEPF